MGRKRRWLLLGLGTAVLLTGGLLFCLIWNGVILLNQPSQEQYPVRGVDVSSYQGEIDWDVLSSEGIQFAFIKATEGSGFTDPYFAVNYAQAQKTDLRIGAYHFFSYDSPGRIQAELFIQTVPKTEGMLPPVVDLEFYGDKRENLPEVQAARRELDILLEELEAHYEKSPFFMPQRIPTRFIWRAPTGNMTSGFETSFLRRNFLTEGNGPSGSIPIGPG